MSEGELSALMEMKQPYKCSPMWVVETKEPMSPGRTALRDKAGSGP